jgi:hypothetical protein
MLEKSPLKQLMTEPLPPRFRQRQLCFRPTLEQVNETYDLLNQYIFDNKLIRPPITLKQTKKCWGTCIGKPTFDEQTQSYCAIELSNKWFSQQWMVTILAHEMAHQFQWDFLGPLRAEAGKSFLMSHGPSFFLFKKKLAQHLIPLKVSHSKRKWFAHQDLFIA